MKMRLIAVCSVLAALSSNNALAQDLNLTGQYRCVQACQPPFGWAYITQNGWTLSLVNEAGQPSPGYVDWFTRGRIWAPNWNEGAVFSPDGLVIQFDRGAVWQLRRRM
jgi:hypothetical protein